MCGVDDAVRQPHNASPKTLIWGLKGARHTHSRILDQNGFELARAGEDPTLLVAHLDMAKVEAARRNLPTIRDSAPAFIQSELSKYLASVA